MAPQEELELRERQLAARADKPGMGANCAALRGRIATLKSQIGKPE